METGTDASSQESDVRSLKLVVGTYILVFAMKLAVYIMTGVMAIFAEALHTLSDIFVSSFLLVAIIWSRKEADEVHMFGYGRAQNVAATIFISFTRFELYREAIPRLFAPEEGSYRNLPLAMGILIVSMIIAAIIVATIIAFNAVGLFRENMSFLLGRSPGQEYLKRIENITRSVEGVLGVHDLRAEKVREKVHQEVKGGYCVIHVDPAEIP